MPYKSKAQAAYLHIHEPKVAKRWDRKYGKTGPLPAYAPTKRKKIRSKTSRRQP